jgi:hypothetical protein
MSQSTEHIAELVDAFLNDGLAEEQARRVEAHCQECPACAATLQEARRCRALLNGVPANEAPETLIQQTLQFVEVDAARSRKRRERIRRFLYAAAALLPIGVAGVVLAILANQKPDRYADTWPRSSSPSEVIETIADFGKVKGNVPPPPPVSGGGRSHGPDPAGSVSGSASVGDGLTVGAPPDPQKDANAELRRIFVIGGIDYRKGKDDDPFLDQLTGRLPDVGGRGSSSGASSGSGCCDPCVSPSSGSGSHSADKKPTVWKKDRQQPSIARVYVGDGNSLELVSMQVTVTIDGPRARTVVDHVFRNPHERQLEGTFEYPLPTGASPSYFAMFLGQTRDTVPPMFAGRNGEAPNANELARLAPTQMVKSVSSDEWGKLQEAKFVSKEKGLETYEEITRRRIDPALLEYAGGNTFRGRVFPIPRQGYNRVILAYEETLPMIAGKVTYRFPLPECKLRDVQFTLMADTDQCKDAKLEPEGQKSVVFERTYFTRSWQEKGPGGEALFSYGAPQTGVQAISGRDGDGYHLYARVRPDLPGAKDKPFAEHAVFLLDTSLSENAGRFGVNMSLMRKILEKDPDIKKFNVLAFNVGTAWVEPKGWIENTEAGRKKLFDRLDGLVLEGATDLSAALDTLAGGPPGGAADAPLNVFVLSDGQATWGQRDAAVLAARFESHCGFPVRFQCYRVGLGAENQELFEALTRRGGAIFQCYSEADVAKAAVAHRNQCLQISAVRVEGEAEASDVLVAGRQAAVYPDGEVLIAARCKNKGKARIVLEGTYLGRRFSAAYPVTVTGSNELASRGWAEIAVASLLSLNDPKLDRVITAYCQRYNIGSRVASFLVLERDSDYQQLNLETENREAIKGDLAGFLSKCWKTMGQDLSARAEFERFLGRVGPHVHLFDGEAGKQVSEMLKLLSDKDFELPTSVVRGALLGKDDVSEAYRVGLQEHNVNAYLKESARRADAQDIDGAVRALSNLIEDNPTRGDALRLAGYHLLDMNQAAQAAQLFLHVQRDRPFEPHSYRDLARSLEECDKPALAALQYEIVLAGEWHSRFGQDLKNVVREEYAHLMRDAIQRKLVTGKLADHFGERLERMASQDKPSDLRVTITWNTDNTDVDLWVIEPGGEKCFYQHRTTKNGGELSQDCTQGYGPERYQAVHTVEGEYIIKVHYYSANPNLVTGETQVQVVITKHAGTPEESSARRTVVLKNQGQEVEVARLKF